VVDVALTGVCIELSSVVVVLVCVEGRSTTVLQADSDTMAAAARHEIISVFISRFVV